MINLLSRTMAALFLVVVFSSNAFAAAASFDDIKRGETDAVAGTKRGHKDYLKEKDLEKNEFSTQFRAGLLNLTGNTRALSISGGNRTLIRLKRFENNFRIGGYYSRVFSVRSQAGLTGTVARYIYGSYRLDYYITDTFSSYAGGGGYSDPFDGIERSGFGLAGLRYFFLKRSSYYLSGAAGYRYAYESRVPPNPNANFHMASGEINYWQRINDILSITNDTTLLENILEGHDFRAENRTELKVSLTDRLSLILGFEAKFRNRPVPGFRKFDTATELLFAATF